LEEAHVLLIKLSVKIWGLCFLFLAKAAERRYYTPDQHPLNTHFSRPHCGLQAIPVKAGTWYDAVFTSFAAEKRSKGLVLICRFSRCGVGVDWY